VDLLERGSLLEELQELHTAAAAGTGAMVFVSGEAGIGKTSLTRRFCDGLPEGTAVHRGFCDALGTPRALGPLYDIARTSLAGLSPLLTVGQDRHTLFTAFLDLLGTEPSVTVVEDAHWADEATLDLLTFVARRVVDLPGVVMVTYRSEDVDRDHPLRRLLGDVATVRSVRRMSVPALSQAAVHALAEAAGRDGAKVHAVTGGNPFFVTEVLGAPTDEVPATVRDAVLARVSRLGDDARAMLDLVSLLPDRIEMAMLEPIVAEGDSSPGVPGLDDALQSGMLVLDGATATVGFRHELARQAVEADVPPTRATELHGRILAALTASDDVDPARLSFHAAGAGDAAAVLRHAPVAGRQAARLGAYREAAEHYRRALGHVAGAPAAHRAELWEARTDACERTHWMTALASGGARLAEALEASARAIELWHAVGDAGREAAMTARRSHLLWSAGRHDDARAAASTAATLVEPLPPGPISALTYTALARLSMLATDDAEAMAFGTTAVAQAQRHGDGTTLAHALGVVGSLHWATDPDRAAQLLTAGLQAARDAGDELTAGALLCNLGAGAAEARSYPLAERWLDEAVAWCAERDLDSLRDHAMSWLARCQLEQGRWGEATATASAALHVPTSGVSHAGAGHAVALTVVGRLRSRRGDPDAQTPLERAWSLVEGSGDVRRLWPVAAALAESAWLAGENERITDLVLATYRLAVAADLPWATGELGHWLWVAGASTDPAARVAPPYALQAAGDWSDAATAWRELGCSYEMALALAEHDDKQQRVAALNELQRLGAWPAAEVLARRLREDGVRGLPRRPRRATRDNPAQLTDRQVDVLNLVADGLRNADIAAALHISPKTVDHHISAILAKLGVGTRGDAAQWVRAHGAKDGVSPAQT
jgi:DNA-binding CsgD family transcriptional regulator/tetratricopeptide (TPR) repeat protein